MWSGAGRAGCGTAQTADPAGLAPACGTCPAWAGARPARCGSARRDALREVRECFIDEIRGEFIAIDAALARLQPGDLSLILVDQVEEALAHLSKRIAAG